MALLYGRAGRLTVTFGGCRAVLRELGHRHKPDDVSLMMQDCHQLSRGLSRRAFIRWRAGSVTLSLCTAAHLLHTIYLSRVNKHCLHVLSI